MFGRRRRENVARPRHRSSVRLDDVTDEKESTTERDRSAGEQTGDGNGGPEQVDDADRHAVTEWYADEDADATAAGAAPDGGPWDGGDQFPVRERADFGSLLVPVVPTQQLELVTDGERVVWVTVRGGQSELRVHAFAAPKSGGLWAEVRQEIVAELGAAGVETRENAGPFGTELFGHVPVEPTDASAGLVPVRFIGVDGPRWLLRGLLIGAAATGEEPAGPYEDVLRDVVVVRGDHPVPPRDLLELRLPPDVQQAIDEQMAAQAEQSGQPDEDAANRFFTDLNPFERGPEFTETR